MSLGVRAMVLGLLTGMAVAPGARAAPQAFPTFPLSETTPQIGRWLATQTDLPPASVVLVAPGYVFSYAAPDPAQGGGNLVWRQVREEVTDVVMASRLNGRSATATLAFDCARNSATASNVVVYAGNNLKGDGGRSVPASDWLTANPGLYLMDLAKAACDRDFRGPFANAGVLATTTSTPSPAPPALRGEAAPRPAASGPEHWVQVGAFVSPAAANQRWREIQRLLPAQTAGHTIRLEPAGRDGKLLRAIAGPYHGTEAGAFCAALKFRGGDCLVR